MITVGSEVTKKSGKTFQNGEKVAVVKELTAMTFPCSNSRYDKAREKGTRTEVGVILEGCEDPIRLSMIQEGIFKKWPSVENTYQKKFIDVFLAEFPELAEETYKESFPSTARLKNRNRLVITSG